MYRPSICSKITQFGTTEVMVRFEDDEDKMPMRIIELRWPEATFNEDAKNEAIETTLNRLTDDWQREETAKATQAADERRQKEKAQEKAAQNSGLVAQQNNYMQERKAAIAAFNVNIGSWLDTQLNNLIFETQNKILLSDLTPEHKLHLSQLFIYWGI